MCSGEATISIICSSLQRVKGLQEFQDYLVLDIFSTEYSNRIQRRIEVVRHRGLFLLHPVLLCLWLEKIKQPAGLLIFYIMKILNQFSKYHFPRESENELSVSNF